MLTFDSTTTAALNLAASKLAWCEIIATALGATGRTLVCKRAASGDAWATGTVFRDLDMTGTISTTGAVLSSLGVTSNARVQLAADLTTGVSVWRISNAAGTRWMQGTLGAIGSGADVERPNPTATSGDDFGGVTIRPPALLPSGTGPAAPAWTSDTPYTIVAESYETGSPVEAWRLDFNVRDENFVYEAPFMAEETGDVAVHLSDATGMCGDIECGILMMRVGGHVTESGRPHERVLIGMKPSIPGWPGSSLYNKATMNTFLPPFKFRVLNMEGVELYVMQMRDGLPINHKSMGLDEFYDPSTGTVAVPVGSGPKWGTPGHVVRPHIQCEMFLQYCNEHPKIHSKAKTRLHNGIVAQALFPRHARKQASTNEANRMFSVYDMNSHNNMFMIPQWPQPSGNLPRPTPIDPFMADPNAGTAAYVCRMTGWDYEYGSISGHTWFSGPGGPRFGRSALSSQMTMGLSDMEGFRPEGMVPWRRIYNAYGDAYFNHARQQLSDPRLFTPAITKTQTLNGSFGVQDGYYQSGSITAANTLVTLTTGRGNKYGNPNGSDHTPSQYSLDRYYDSTGRHPRNFYEWESNLHGHGQPGEYAIFGNSPAHALLQTHAYNNWSAGVLGNRPPGTNATSYFGQRTHAWRWLSHVMTWACGSKHRLVFSQQEIEDGRIKIELMRIYTDVWVPTYELNSQDLFFDGIRKMGKPGAHKAAEGSDYITHNGDGGGLFYYMGQALHLWKVTGLWDRVWSWGLPYQRVLKMVIDCLDKASIEWILATRGRFGGAIISLARPTPDYVFTAADIPADYYALDAIFPDTGLKDWNHDESGQIVWDEEATTHMKPQWLSIHKHFFTEFPHPDLDAAIAAFDAYYIEKTELNSGWARLVPSHGRLNPLEVEE